VNEGGRRGGGKKDSSIVRRSVLWDGLSRVNI
jgi:hypothetical protein